jgi:hypothetical protein
MQVLKGKVLYSDDTPFMYHKAYETIKEFESFKRRYYDYLGIESSLKAEACNDWKNKE